MHYRILPRRVSLLIYDDRDDVNYVASCQININGNRGTIDTLNGRDFYRFISEYGFKPFKDLGLVEVGAAVTPSHLYLINNRLANFDIEIHPAEDLGNGLKLHWITIKEKPASIN